MNEAYLEGCIISGEDLIVIQKNLINKCILQINGLIITLASPPRIMHVFFTHLWIHVV